MTDEEAPIQDAKQLLKLAGQDRTEASRQLARLSPGEQLAAICDAAPARRVRLLELTPQPEALIPEIPEAEFCFTVKALGLEDAAWIMEYASAEQIATSLDLDCWDRLLPAHRTFDRWLKVFGEAGDDTVLRAGQALDPELWVLFLRDALFVELKPDGAEGWEPADGAQTLDGQVYYTARNANVDLAAVHQLLRVLHQRDYWLFFRLMQGCIWELESDLEEWALRWRNGRLQDLGFPSWDEAMQIYGFIRPDQRNDLPLEGNALDVSEWHLPVWIPDLPSVADPRHAVFRAAAELDPEGRRSFYYAFIALANKVAVADHRPLGDIETLPSAIEKAASLASQGLESISTECSLEMTDVLRRVPLDRLFRVGANLDPAGAARDRGQLGRDDEGVEGESEEALQES